MDYCNSENFGGCNYLAAYALLDNKIGDQVLIVGGTSELKVIKPFGQIQIEQV